LQIAEKVGQLEQARLYIEEIDGLTKIEKLQDNENEDVYKSAFHMVEKFFSDEVNYLYTYNFVSNSLGFHLTNTF